MTRANHKPRSLKANLSANYIGAAAVAVFSIVFAPIYVRLLGAEAYGLIGFFSSIIVVTVILDLGLSSIKGSKINAALKGLVDAGIKLSISEDILPKEDRISGKHISDYGSKIKDTEHFQKHFSRYLKENVDLGRISDSVSDIKQKIMKVN